MPSIDPTPEQFKAFREAAIDGPINMLNLIRFKPDGGRASYAKYSEHTAPLLEKCGGKVVYRAEGRAAVIGEETWDTIFIVEYPNRKAFLEMIGSEEYQKGVHLRTAAVDDSRLVCMQTP